MTALISIAFTLKVKFPDVCDSIHRLQQRLKNRTITDNSTHLVLCSDLRWDPVRLWGFQRDDKDVKRLEDDIFSYAKKNLAVVNVYIKDPVVTMIRRDQKIPVIAFVANTGGLLGLCMGFSLVSVFEVLYHAIEGARKWWGKKVLSRIVSRSRLVVSSTTAVVARTTTMSTMVTTEGGENENKTNQQEATEEETADATRPVIWSVAAAAAEDDLANGGLSMSERKESGDEQQDLRELQCERLL